MSRDQTAPTPTPLFPVENKFPRREDLPLLDEAMHKIEKSLHETFPTHMMGGGGLPTFIYLQPHNHRLYFAFEKQIIDLEKLKNPPVGNQPRGGLFPVEIKEINRGVELYVRFEAFTVRIKKRQVEVLNLFDHKKLFALNISQSGKDQEARVYEIMQIKKNETLTFFRSFIETFGGSSDFQILNEQVEIKHFDDRLKPLLPVRAKWHNEAQKKVYNEQVIENKAWAYSANLLKNQALYDFSPEVSGALNDLSKYVRDLADVVQKGQNEALIPLTEQIKLHLKVMAHMDESLSQIDSSMKMFRKEISGLRGARHKKVMVASSVTPQLFDYQKAALQAGLSLEDVMTKSKAYKIFRARMLLKAHGWGSQVWN